MSPEELRGLADDILVNGLRERIVVWVADPKRVGRGGAPRVNQDEQERLIEDGEVVDGRNRLEALRLAGIEPTLEMFGTYDDFDGTYDATKRAQIDPYVYVISKNLHRRQLSDSQRSMVAAKIAVLRKGSNQHASIEAPSQARAAEMLNVSRANVQRAAQVQAKGVPALVAAVESGKVKVSAAAAVAKLPKKEQQKLVEKGPAAVTEKAKKTKHTPRERPAVSLPSAIPPTGPQWAILRLQIERVLTYDLGRIKRNSKSAYAGAVRDLRDAVEEIGRNTPKQPELFPESGRSRGTHEAQTRNTNGVAT
jgi:ParB-like chromosome segregation protein Spo0J